MENGNIVSPFQYLHLDYWKYMRIWKHWWNSLCSVASIMQFKNRLPISTKLNLHLPDLFPLMTGT